MAPFERHSTPMAPCSIVAIRIKKKYGREQRSAQRHHKDLVSETLVEKYQKISYCLWKETLLKTKAQICQKQNDGCHKK